MAEKTVSKSTIEKNKELDKTIDIYINGFLDDAVPKFARYRSYDFVHTLFAEAIDSISKPEENGSVSKPDWDYLALNLYMFLGSWGMLRNSFLLENNYKCLIKICKLVCGKDYAWLLDIDPTEKGFKERRKARQDYVKDVCALMESIENIFKSDDICRKKKIKNGEETIYEPTTTDTLVTKILLATLGCIPAYDKYNKASLKEFGCSNSLNIKDKNGTLKELLDFVNAHTDSLTTAMSKAETKRIGMYDKDVPKYSTMKYVDMILWEYARMNGLIEEKD